jgi:hypothetical protein
MISPNLVDHALDFTSMQRNQTPNQTRGKLVDVDAFLES